MLAPPAVDPRYNIPGMNIPYAHYPPSSGPRQPRPRPPHPYSRDIDLTANAQRARTSQLARANAQRAATLARLRGFGDSDQNMHEEL